MVVGPYRSVDLGDGRSADLYLLRYDADGMALSPRTTEILQQSLGGVTDVHVFAHGWNNTFEAAAARYDRFIGEYLKLGAARPGRKLVLVGVIWPSTSFLWPWEQGPDIAAAGEDARTEEMRQFVAEGADPGTAARLSELVDGRSVLSAPEAPAAVRIVLDSLGGGTGAEDGSAPPAVEEVIDSWTQLGGGSLLPEADDDGGVIGSGSVGSPQIAGDGRDVRDLLRWGTVWKMKARSGKVGFHGVGPLVRHLLAHSDAAVHLTGHSFGCRLLMSALAAAEPARKARSLLLLQPAVNRWCFADDVAGTGHVGGYRPVLDRVELPVMSTFSEHDWPLRQAFHLAVRGSSLGEPDIAAVGDTDRYGALGGWGPAGVKTTTAPAIGPGAGRYDLDGARVVAVDGSGQIGGRPAIGDHGDVTNPVTAWALRCLIEA